MFSLRPPSWTAADERVAADYFLHPATVASARRLGRLDRLLEVAARRLGMREAA